MKKFYMFMALSVATLCSAPLTAYCACPAKAENSRVNPKKVETVTFSTHLHCKNCVKKVQENIAYEKGVKSLEVSLEKQTIKVGFDPSKTSAETLAAAIRKLGYGADIKQ